jgi:hypothetical protein
LTYHGKEITKEKMHANVNLLSAPKFFSNKSGGIIRKIGAILIIKSGRINIPKPIDIEKHAVAAFFSLSEWEFFSEKNEI